jgi:uncharacterized membrane protein YkvA (DUF1232 family)
MDKKSPNQLIPGGSEGFLQNTVDYFKLVLRLMTDARVSLWIKLLPIGGLAYMISPLDAFIPYIDDAGIIGLALYMFVQLCPPAVVEEHRQALRQENSGFASSISSDPSPAHPSDEVIDAEFRDTDPKSG